MRPLIERSEWLFAFVKGSTLALAWYAIAQYSRHNPRFTERMCCYGAGAYILIWLTWFNLGR